MFGSQSASPFTSPNVASLAWLQKKTNMRSRFSRRTFALALALLLTPGLCSAVWVCHTGDGRTWQQAGPPCVMPENADEISPAPRSSGKPVYLSNVPDVVPGPRAKPTAPLPDTGIAYDRAVVALEARYPRLNPDSGNFDVAATRAVLQRMQAYVQQGKGADIAIRLAAEDVMATPVIPTPSQAAIVAQPTQRASGNDAMPERVVRGAIVGAVFAGIGLAGLFLRWLLRQPRRAAFRAAQIAGTVAASDAARSVGGVVSSVAEKSGELLRRSGRRGKTPWD